MNKRVLFGLVAAIASQVIFGYLLSFLLISTAVHSGLICFIGAAIGTYVARRNFIIPAILLWSFNWLLIIYILSAMSDFEKDTVTLIQFNFIAMLVSLIAAIVGCISVNAFNSRNQAAII